MSVEHLQSWVQRHINFHKFTKYSLGGLASYLFNIAVTFILTEVVGIHYLSSFIISLALTTLFNFVLAVKFIFNVQKSIASKLLFYIVTVVIIYFLNIQAVKWLVEERGVHYMLSIIASTATLFMIKFLIYDKWVFVDEKPKRKRA